MRIQGVDLLRGIAAFGIVGCHLSLSPRTVGGEGATALCNFNVGVFAAISGFLMARSGCTPRNGADAAFPLEKSRSILTYVRKRVARLMPEYVFWSGVFIVMTSMFDLLLDGGRLNPKYGTVGFWLRVVFLGDAATHLWFLPCLLYAQVVMRILSPLQVKGIVWILVGLLLIVPSAMLGDWFGTYPLRLFAFLVTGYGLGRVNLDLPRMLVGGLAMVGLVAYVLLSGIVPAFIRGWFATIPLLLFFTSLSFNGRVVSAVGVLGATSMGIYLVHPLITRALSVVWVRVFSAPYGVLPVLSEWLLAWGVAFVAAFVLLRLPVVNRFVR